MWLAGLVALAGLLLLPAQALADEDEAGAEPRERPQIYKWIDENGIAHYTTDRSRIPSGLRERIERLGSEPQPLAREAASATAPASAPASGGAASGAAATGGATAAAAGTSRTRRPRGDSFDAWASRNRPATVERDAWDDGSLASDPGLAGDDGEAAPVALSAEEIAAIEAERQEIDTRILELEAEVLATENVLKEWVSVSGTNPLEREDDGTFRTAAQLLPQQLAELAALRERLGELETP